MATLSRAVYRVLVMPLPSLIRAPPRLREREVYLYLSDECTLLRSYGTDTRSVPLYGTLNIHQN